MFSRSDAIMSMKRICKNDNQRSVLNESFANNPYLTKDMAKNLSQLIGLREKTIRAAFVNMRQCCKKKKFELSSSKHKFTLNNPVYVGTIIYSSIFLVVKVFSCTKTHKNDFHEYNSHNKTEIDS